MQTFPANGTGDTGQRHGTGAGQGTVLCPWARSPRGRIIFRHVDQDFLDTIDLQTELNSQKYKLRQMIVEHPFGTIKHNWGAYYFLTRRKASVAAKISLSFLMYNMKRAINILGSEEILRRLRERRKPVMV